MARREAAWIVCRDATTLSGKAKAAVATRVAGGRIAGRWREPWVTMCDVPKGRQREQHAGRATGGMTSGRRHNDPKGRHDDYLWLDRW